MIFTWKTYRTAINRAIDIELKLIQNHDRWERAVKFTERLKARRRREGWWFIWQSGRCAHCGHTDEYHRGLSGPNSIGRWHFGECVFGSETVFPYRFGGCSCPEFTKRFWPKAHF